MAEADTDENGKIGLDEFIAWYVLCGVAVIVIDARSVRRH